MNCIKQLREKHGLTQTELGKKLGVEKSTISKYEKGSLHLNAKTIAKLCDIFNVSADVILGRIDSLQTNNNIPNSKTDNTPENNNNAANNESYKKIVKKLPTLTPKELEKVLRILEIMHEDELEKGSSE